MANSKIIKVHKNFDSLLRQLQKDLERDLGRDASLVNISKLIADDYRGIYQRRKRRNASRNGIRAY